MGWQSRLNKPINQYLQNKINGEPIEIRLAKKRRSKLGDYCKKSHDKHIISINEDLSSSSFLLTLCHELAHYFAFQKYGFRIKPHGLEWKKTFRDIFIPLMPMMNIGHDLKNALQLYMLNPKASSYQSLELKRLLNCDKDIIYLNDLRVGAQFELCNGRQFQLLSKKRTRARCLGLRDKQYYSVHLGAEVMPFPGLHN